MHEIEPQRRIFVGYDERETLSAFRWRIPGQCGGNVFAITRTVLWGTLIFVGNSVPGKTAALQLQGRKWLLTPAATAHLGGGEENQKLCP